ncbi:hypothetical protein YC2023_087201 [Brassica napus]
MLLRQKKLLQVSNLSVVKALSIHKAISERCHDAPTNRWRRYKRAASFDSRKIVIIFSILSSVGTLILIYLTLRVRLINGDNSFNHIYQYDCDAFNCYTTRRVTVNGPGRKKTP